ncbi:MAG TPA: endonuclease/exonuclease/phosphatase family protein [Fimbriimonas sp.]
MRKKRSRGTGLVVLVWINLAALAAIYVGGHFIAEKSSLTTLVAYVPQPVYLVPTAALFLGLVLNRRLKALLILGVPTGCLSMLLLGFQLPNRSVKPPRNELTVLTFNIHHAPSGWQEVADLIREQKPDIACLQETDRLARGGRVTQPLEGYELAERGSLSIYSRFPIKDVEVVPLSPAALPAVSVATGGVRVVNAHLASFPNQARDVTRWRSWPRTFATMARIHRREVEQLIRHDETQPPPTIVCGDFNGPPRGEVYGLMRSRFADSFEVSGTGLGFTFPSVLPVQRIDYVFARDLQPLEAKVIRTTISDHRPLLARLRR